jgi:hypothetical protein
MAASVGVYTSEGLCEIFCTCLTRIGLALARVGPSQSNQHHLESPDFVYSADFSKIARFHRALWMQIQSAMHQARQTHSPSMCLSFKGQRFRVTGMRSHAKRHKHQQVNLSRIIRLVVGLVALAELHHLHSIVVNSRLHTYHHFCWCRCRCWSWW